MAAAEAWGGTLASNDRPELIGGLRMGDGLFDTAWRSAVAGTYVASRRLPAGQRSCAGAEPQALATRVWRRPGSRGQQVMLSGESYTVVGVMPPQFQFPPFWSTRAEMWTPLDLRPRATSRGGNSLRVFARLKPGVSSDAGASRDRRDEQTTCRRLTRRPTPASTSA